MIKNPNFFAVTDSIIVEPEIFKFNGSKQVYLIQFRTQNLEQPSADPIGVFFENGNRNYIWRDKFWMEIDLPVHPLQRTVRSWLEKQGIDLVTSHFWRLFTDYNDSWGLTDKDNVDNPETRDKVFTRAIYEVNERPVGAT